MFHNIVLICNNLIEIPKYLIRLTTTHYIYTNLCYSYKKEGEYS